MYNNQQVRVAVADDHKIFRSGLVSSLAPFSTLKVVLIADSGQALLDGIPVEQPDVILLDMKMPDMDGLEVCRAITKQYPRIHVIGLSVYDHHLYIAGLFEAGASGYLLKDVEPVEIVKAIQVVHKDGSYLQEKAPLRLVKKLMDMNHPSVYYDAEASHQLTNQEVTVLQHIAREYTSTEIAGIMSLSPKTIENYRSNLLMKTGAKNTAGLVTYAIRKGLVLV
jgi:DNA-binding NarL/FixJ family response regulator